MAFLRVGGGRRKKLPSWLRPLRAWWAGRSPSPSSARPAGGGRSSPRSSQSLFSPSGRVGEGEESAEGRRGDLTSGREVLSSRELSGRVSGPAGTRRAPPAPPRPLPGRPRPSPRPRGRKNRSEKSVRGTGAKPMGVGGTRTTWKVFFLGRAGEGASSWRVRLWVCELGCVCPDCGVLAGVVPTPGRKLSRGPFEGPNSLGSHPERRAAPAPGWGERAGGGFVWFQKCTLLTAGGAPPPGRRGGGGEGAAESDSCGWGQREGPGAGRVREPARVPLSFGTKESLSLRHLSLPGGPRKRGAWGRQPEESLCASGPSGRPSVSRASRGKSAQSPGEGAANMESGLRAEGGGAARRWEPSPLPSPSGPSSEHKAERAGSVSPAPRRVSQPRAAGEGGGNQTFSCPGTDT